MLKDNPNVEPLGFHIPSERYYDHHMMQQVRHSGRYMNDEEWEDYKTIPNYIITGHTLLGGNYDYMKSAFNLKNFTTSISIGNCNFLNSIDIQQLISSSYIKFTRCEFDEGVKITNLKANSIIFEDCNFKNKNLVLTDCSLNKVTIKNCSNISITVKNDVKKEISQIIVNDFTHSINTLLFTECEDVEDLTIIGENIGKIEFKNFFAKKTLFNLIADDLQIVNYPLLEGKQEYFFIEDCEISVNNKKENSISLVENVSIKNFILTGTLQKSTLNIIDVKINNISIRNFINEGKLRFNNVQLMDSGQGEILRSQLGKSEFNYVDFSKAKNFKIFLSNITEIIINNAIFPENIIGKDDSDFQGSREIYRQLKNAASKQSDRINELYYERIEMVNMEKILKNSKNWNDKFIFWTNRLSNDYGQSWSDAIILLFIVCLYLFCGIKLILFSMVFDTPPTLQHLSQFINFTLNPLHKFSDIFYSYPEDIDLNQLGLAQVLDTISRLFSGYMLFQFLRAFRKFSR